MAAGPRRKRHLEKQNNFFIGNEYEEIKNVSDELDNYIEHIKIDMINCIGGSNINAIESNQKVNVSKVCNIDVTSPSSQILIGKNNDGKAYELRKKIEYTRNIFLKNSAKNKSISDLINILLSTEVPKDCENWGDSWEILYFNHAPLISSFNTLTSIQRNIRIAENEILSFIHINQLKAENNEK